MMMGYDKAVDMWSVGVITYILYACLCLQQFRDVDCVIASLCGYPPFHDKVPSKLYDKIKRGEFKFHDKYWIDISDYGMLSVFLQCSYARAAKDFIRKCLVVDPRVRVTAKQALAHPWLSVRGRFSLSCPYCDHDVLLNFRSTDLL